MSPKEGYEFETALPAPRPARRVSRRAVLAALLIAGLSVAAARPCSAQPDYKAEVWQHQTNSTLAISSGPTAPQSVSHFSVPPMQQDSHATADRGEIRNDANAVAYGTNPNGAMYRNFVDGTMLHRDFVFTCQDGRPTVTAQMRLRIKGHATVFMSQPATPAWGWYGVASMVVGGMVPNPVSDAGTWVAHTGNVANGVPGSESPPPPSTGMFAGIDSDVLDGVFLGPSFTAPTNTAQTISVVLSLRPQVGQVGPNWSGYVQSVLDFNTPGPDGERIGFPVGSPAFELPEGCTCNSTQAGIVANYWCGPNGEFCATGVASAAPVSWGNVKTLFR